MSMGEINGRVIYRPKGKALEYAENAANFYVGCGGNRQELKKTLREYPYALDIFTNELLKHKDELQKTGLFFSFTTDPLLPETQRLTRQAVGVCQRNGVPVKILSKCAEGLNRFIDFAEASDGWDISRIALGATLTGCDELEPNADTNTMRVNMLARAKRHGFRTFASVEPIPPGMYELAIGIIKLSYPFVDLYKIGLQSGGKYPKREIRLIYDTITEYWEGRPEQPRIYWKDSIVNPLGIDRGELPWYCVPVNWDLFNNEK